MEYQTEVTMSNNLEQRVVELESKVAFQDDTIDQLNTELSQHQESIHQLQQKITLLGNRFKEIKDEMDMDQPQQLEYELPPHY
jgi:SlyX protein